MPLTRYLFNSILIAQRLLAHLMFQCVRCKIVEKNVLSEALVSASTKLSRMISGSEKASRDISLVRRKQ
jgi:hypothetical protein